MDDGAPGAEPSTVVIERTHYYAKPGRAAEVLRTRRRASEVRRRLGLPAGRIFTRSATAAEGPDVVWECAFADPAAHARDLDARARSEEFGAVRAHMTALIDRFERLVLVPDPDPGPGRPPGAGTRGTADEVSQALPPPGRTT
jgi:hypothetical protein